MDTGVRFTATAQAFTPAVASNAQSIAVTVKTPEKDQTLSPAVAQDAQNVAPALSIAITLPAPEYDGPYEVTPAVDKQIMPTDQKLMTDDMTINAIPYYDVSNTSGGSTVYIG